MSAEVVDSAAFVADRKKEQLAATFDTPVEPTQPESPSPRSANRDVISITAGDGRPWDRAVEERAVEEQDLTARWYRTAVQCLAFSTACLLLYAAICWAPFSLRIRKTEGPPPPLPPVQMHHAEVTHLPSVPNSPTKRPEHRTAGVSERDELPVEIIAHLDGRIEPYTRH